MWSTWGTIVLFGFGIVVLLLSQSRADELMQDLFLDTKCNTCHKISVLRIEKLKNTAASAEGEDDKEDSGTMHDLSATLKFPDADFLDKFLRKEIAHTPHEGETSTKKHPLTLKGPAEELTQLSSCLLNLKSEPKK
jgi:hypothetical protein